VEAFRHHVAKIELFDLYLPHNQTPVWKDKKGDTGQEMRKAIHKEVQNVKTAPINCSVCLRSESLCPKGISYAFSHIFCNESYTFSQVRIRRAEDT